MSREAKLLLKKNNKRDNEILPENQEIYTNMIVYLRGADITEYNQEKVREDLINMIVDGQNRGDDIQKVIGDNYKEICDEIIKEMPKKTKLEKMMDIVMISLDCIWILGIISVIQSVFKSIIKDDASWQYEFTTGYLISWIVIVIVANVIVNVVCKRAFDQDNDKTKKSKIKTFIVTWIVCFVVLCAIVLPKFLLNTILITIHVGMAVAVFAAFFVASRLLSIKY